jgi:uncharacterized protein (DUF983 family)
MKCPICKEGKLKDFDDHLAKCELCSSMLSVIGLGDLLRKEDTDGNKIV